METLYKWSKGPLPFPKFKPAFIAPAKYSLDFFTAPNMSIPLARFTAIADDKVQPVP